MSPPSSPSVPSTHFPCGSPPPPTFTSPSCSSRGDIPQRRNSSGDVPPKRPSSASKLKENGIENGKKIVPSVFDPGKRSSLENRCMSLPSLYSKLLSTVAHSETIKSSLVSRLSLKSDIYKTDAVRKTSTKPFVPESVPSSRRVTSSSVDGSISRNSLRKITSNTSLLAAHSPSATSNFKLRSMSSSVDRGLSSSSRKKTSALEGRDSRFMMLPQVDVKAGDELLLPSESESDEVTSATLLVDEDFSESFETGSSIQHGKLEDFQCQQPLMYPLKRWLIIVRLL